MPTESPEPHSATPAALVHCSDFNPSDCAKAVDAARAAVSGHGTATEIWLNSGTLCFVSVECLFDPNANFPMDVPPSGGSPIGNAEVALYGSREHAGMNMARVGDQIIAELIGYKVPPLSWCTGGCPSSSTTDGLFKLELVFSRSTWPASAPLEGMAILSYLGDAPTTISGSGGGVIAFSYHEVGGGNRKVDWVMRADCRGYALDPATPITQPLNKSGSIDPSDPSADWERSFLTDPQIHLPVGAWDIIATADFAERGDCSGTHHSIDSTVRLTIVD